MNSNIADLRLKRDIVNLPLQPVAASQNQSEASRRLI